MREADLKAFAAAWGATFRLVGQPAPGEDVTRAAFRVLIRYSLEQVKRALEHHLRHSPYPPKPCDVVRFLEGTPEQQAAEAWGRVLEAHRRHGGSRSVCFPHDPALHYAVRLLGGWASLRQWGDDQEPFRRRDFLALYARGLQVATWETEPRVLSGDRYSSDLPVIDAETGQEIQEQAAALPERTHGPAELAALVGGLRERLGLTA